MPSPVLANAVPHSRLRANRPNIRIRFMSNSFFRFSSVPLPKARPALKANTVAPSGSMIFQQQRRHRHGRPGKSRNYTKASFTRLPRYAPKGPSFCAAFRKKQPSALPAPSSRTDRQPGTLRANGLLRKPQTGTTSSLPVSLRFAWGPEYEGQNAGGTMANARRTFKRACSAPSPHELIRRGNIPSLPDVKTIRFRQASS